jgi:hypothetical protein
MKTKIIVITASVTLVVAGVVAVLVVTTSRATASQTNPAEAHSTEPWSFKEGRGITLSEVARRATSISVAPVESAELTPERNGIAAQVYRSAAESTDQKTAAASLWVPSAEAATLSVGQTVALSNGQSEFPATVAAVKATTQAGAPLEILLTVNDEGAKLRVGDFLQARVGQGDAKRREATTIPASAVIESVRGNFVYAANGGAFLRTPVTLGSRQGDRIEVVDGLFEGDEIVTAGASSLWMIELQAVNGGKGCADGH